MADGKFDLSTPEGRLERGVYDQAVDPYIAEATRLRVEATAAKAKIVNRPDVRSYGDAEAVVEKEFSEMIRSEDELVLTALKDAIEDQLQIRDLRQGLLDG
jgi:hypothetical protein